MRLNDNVGRALATLLYHQEAFALTGGALRRILYGSTGRDDSGAGWCVGFARLWRQGYITSIGNPKVRGHRTWTLTEKGRARLAKVDPMPRAFDVDPDAWLKDAHRYHRGNIEASVAA